MAYANIRGSGIYAIVNTVTGKRYVGSAISIDKRWGDHRKALRGGRHHSIKLQRSWGVHGESAFALVVLEQVCDAALLIEREQHWIDTLDTYRNGYNAVPTAGSQRGYRHTEATRQKMSEAGKRRVARGVINGKGREFTEEHRARLSAAAKARVRKPHSAETRAKLAKASAKLTEAGVREIRERAAAGETQEAIAKIFGVTDGCISHVVTRRKWAHVA